jgi:cohesin complex subunit SA-1/2
MVVLSLTLFGVAAVFGKGRNADTTAAEWLAKYQREQQVAMREMVNFVLRCTGTDLEVDDEDIEDVDHVPKRVEDYQHQYQQRGIAEWPLISRAKTFRAFQPVLEEFFRSFIQTLHHSSVLYDDQALFENLEIWLSALSTSACRPFRHTATIISLTIMCTFCDIARDLMTTVSTSRKQLESEKKKKSVNQGRVAAIDKAIKDGEKKLEILDDFLKDGVNVVFVHRYRDIDPILRSACMAALGQWIRSYREYFFEGQFLRYFGWMLSDTVAQTRLVVVNQLRSLYENKDNIAGMRSYTGRFRQRMVEMAAHDADIGVRASAIELVDLIRDAGLIEPSDVDTVGRLVFDSEPKIRKAAGRFFVANVQDVFDSTIEEVRDEINDMFGDEDEDDFESPKRSWIKFKCLADTLQAYDELENEYKPDQPTAASKDILSGAPMDSRFVLITEAIYPYLNELAQWQSLAGYLLYDHSQIADDPSEEDTTGAIKKLYKMQEGQEVILLEVLCCAVKLHVLEVAKSDIDKRGRKVKTLTDKIPELQEEIAHNLAQTIPQLLNRFGSVPEAASAVLRLEHLVDLDKIQDLQKDATAYISLLNDINKQFLTHSDHDVLAEASVAFLHAKSSDDIREALENKVQELWEDMIDTLSTLAQKKEVLEGRSIPDSTLNRLTNTVTRISNLASVTDCKQILETTPSRTKGKSKDKAETPFNILMHLAERGLRETEDDEESARAETELVSSSIRTLLFYFMWKVQSLTTALSAGKASFNTEYFEVITKSRELFVSTLVAIMQARSGLDDIRFSATTTLLDLQTLFGTLRHAGQNASNDEDVIFQTQSLVHEIGPDAQSLIAKIHGIAERTYAKKLRLSFEPADDDAPESDPELDKDPSDDEDESGSEAEFIANERLRSSIVAEQRLCELTGKLVLAIVGRIIDAFGEQRGQLKKRLVRHKAELGHNYREVLAFLDEPKPKNPRPKAKQQPATKEANKDQSSSSKRQGDHKLAERVEEEDNDDEEDEQSHVEEDDDEDLRERGLVEDDNIELDIEDEGEENPAAVEDEVMGD